MIGDRVRLLLVDDDEDDYLLTRDVLAGMTGMEYTLDWADSYEAALAEIDRQAHDVYLLDYHLGPYSGLELVRAIAASGSPAASILLTGQGDQDVDIQAMESGAADYLVKHEITPVLLERSIRHAGPRARLIRQRDDALAAARTERERYKAAGELTSDFAYAYRVRSDGEVVIEWMSGAFDHITGYTLEELNGPDNWDRLIHPEDQAAFQERSASLRAGIPYTGEFRVIAGDGTVHWLREILRGRAGADEQDWIGYGAVQEITTGKPAEETLRKSEGGFRALTEYAADLVVALDEDGIFRYVSPSHRPVLGYDPLDLLGRPLRAKIHPDDFARLWEMFAAVVVTGEDVTARFRFLHHDGTWHILETVSRGRFGDPDLKGIITTSRDVTAREEDVDSPRRDDAS